MPPSSARIPAPRQPRAAETAPASPARTTPRTPASPVAPARPKVNLAVVRPTPAAGGDPLAPAVKKELERSFKADLSAVRVHADGAAHKVAVTLGARAVTHGTHVFLGPGASADDLPLMAHEIAHVVQQRGGPAVQRWSESGGDRFEHEAQQASAAVTRGDAFTVRERTDRPRVQRFGISNILDKLAGLANNIPGFRLFTVVLGVNPVNMSSVPRTAANLLRAAVEIIPGGGIITSALDSYGIFDKVGTWVEQQIASLGMVGSAIRAGLMKFLDSIELTDLVPWNLGKLADRALETLAAPARQIKDFVIGLATDILKFIKDALLKPLAKLAEGTRGYDLLKAVLGEDPVTGDPVPQTAETLIPGFLKLIGEEETWQNMQKSGAIPRAWAWFQGAMAAVIAFVKEIPGLVISTVKSLTLSDVFPITGVFVKVGKAFGGFIGRFISWAGTALWNLLEIIFEVVSPGALGYIKKTGAALKSILKNPAPFVGNLIKAAKGGFGAFGSNFGNHLKAALISWLTGSLPGVYIPKSFALGELVKFVLSVLGLSWANVRQKLVKAIGEVAVKALETGFDLVVTLVTKGPAAFWEQLKDNLSTLKDMVIQGIIDMVVDMVVKKAIPKLVAMFIPGAGFISLILTIYDTVMVFVNKIKQIIAVVTGFIDSIVAIAAGNIGAAVKRVESILAGLLSLAISFLAGFAGLGKVADKVMGVLNKVRAPIDKALDKLVAWVVAQAKKLGRLVAQAGLPADPAKRLELGIAAALAVVNRFSGKTVGKLVIAPLLAGVKTRYGFTTLELVPQGGIWWVDAAINPRKKQPSKHVKVGTGADNYPAGQVKMPLTVVTFFVKGPKGNKPGLDKVEFDRQLKIQKDAINDMVLQTWIGNRTKFDKGGRESKGDNNIKILKARFEDQLNGGPMPPKPTNPDARDLELYKLVLLAQSELERMQNAIIEKDPTLANAANAAKLRAAVKKMFKASAGLHRVDQYAGGGGTDIAGLGGEREDFSIGAAWAQASKVYRSRAETIHKFITDKIDKTVWSKEKMNIDLVSQAK